MKPPVVSQDVANTVTKWHETAIKLLHDRPAGWRQLALDGLDGLKNDLSAADYKVIDKYVAIARITIQEVQ